MEKNIRKDDTTEAGDNKAALPWRDQVSLAIWFLLAFFVFIPMELTESVVASGKPQNLPGSFEGMHCLDSNFEQAGDDINTVESVKTKITETVLLAEEQQKTAGSTFETILPVVKRQKPFRLLNLPPELVNAIVHELILEDKDIPTVSPAWLNMAKTCKFLYEAVSNFYFTHTDFRLVLSDNAGSKYSGIVQATSEGWSYAKLPQDLSFPTQKLRKVENMRLCRWRTQHFCLPKPSFLVSLTMHIEQMDQLLKSTRDLNGPGDLPICFPRMRQLTLCATDQEATVWPWANDQAFLPTSQQIALDDEADEEKEAGGFWVGIRMFEDMLSMTPKLEKCILKHDGKVEFAHRLGEFYYGLHPHFKIPSDPIRLKRFEFLQNAVLNHVDALLAELAADGEGKVTRLTRRQLRAKQDAHQRAILQI